MMVLDASALVKLVVEEEDSELARRTYKRELAARGRILVPYLALPESLNSLWKRHALRKELGYEKFEAAVDDLLAIFDKLEKVQEASIAKLAMRISSVQRLPAYDSIYVAISRVNNAPLLTFDELLVRKAGELEIRLAA